MRTLEKVAGEEMKKAKPPVPAVEKALDVLELLADSPNGLTINDIGDALGRTIGEIYRVVVYLAERDYLRQDPDTNRYGLTLRLFELSHRHDPTERLIHAALPILEHIAARTEQSCHLGALNRENILVLTSITSPRPAGYSVRTGALFPIEQTSSGHVILAFSDADKQARYLARRQAPERERLRKRLARIRKEGYEDTRSTMVEGVQNLCVPVFDSRGVCAAITSGFIARIDATVPCEECLAIIRSSGIELSRSLGFNLEKSPYRKALSP
ncbi:MAG: IclR family transcriptional regulator [Ectothiorhodospiraceae bacterium AqS1]|nr:IclR family transcriptional regulator [Ectothiorhodospiraceae bacterium AqS1]